MALTAQKALEMLTDLEGWLSMKAAEEAGMDEPDEPPSEEAMEGAGESGAPPGAGDKGVGVVIALKPKGGPGGEKVPGCADCEAGTPHQHMGR